ncbi:hypothetical protein [Bacillus thuringiensis]|uniref:hypothetical protein n=1 Tax=Bacillus thuringiensis TaxID=1428 RepID=UPI0021D6931A|nr:hypothetical protein [Bacillus thuringiensis]MCU7667818.1 hypothetical protein [Bacillus thuringiensis]
MKEKLAQTINALSDAFQIESEQKYAAWAESIVKEYDFLDIQKPEEFSLLLSQTLDEQADLLVHIALSHIDMDSKKKHKIEFTYLQYQFIERHLESIILPFEGLSCSTDKTRWLIDTYIEYLISSNLPTVEEKKFWHPKHGGVGEWMEWIDSMYDLYYGKFEQYAVIKHKIMQYYGQKMNE